MLHQVPLRDRLLNECLVALDDAVRDVDVVVSRHRKSHRRIRADSLIGTV